MPNANPKVLVVDDDPEIIEFVREALSPQGFEVLSAESGEQGLRVAVRDAVDVILMDILMPGKDGLETIMDLRRRQNPARIIAMSGGGSFHLANALTWAEKMGAHRTLRKPFTPQELLVAVREALDTAAS